MQQTINNQNIKFVPALNQGDFEKFIQQGAKDSLFAEKVFHRAAYVFQQVKAITLSQVNTLNYVNALDNEHNVGHFNIVEFAREIEFSGDFNHKYDKPYGTSIPTSFLYEAFEDIAENEWKKFQEVKSYINDESIPYH